MELNNIHTASGPIFKMKAANESTLGALKDIKVGTLLEITKLSDNDFQAKPYGVGFDTITSQGTQPFLLFYTDSDIGDYIHDLLEMQRQKHRFYIFMVKGTFEDNVEVISYSFLSIIEYRTPIVIGVGDSLSDKMDIQQMEKKFVWNRLGLPAVLCVNKKGKQSSKIDAFLLSEDFNLQIENTPAGLYATKLQKRYGGVELPIDLYLAPKIEFVNKQFVEINKELYHKLDQPSIEEDYVELWNKYNRLQTMVVEDECDEFGSLEYSLEGDTIIEDEVEYEFKVSAIIDSSFRNKEVNAYTIERENSVGKIFDVGTIIEINNHRIITRLKRNGVKIKIPEKGILKLNTAGDDSVLSKRELAKKRIIDRKTPIKSLIKIIEDDGTVIHSEAGWSTNKAITHRLKRNYKKAADLNSDQIKAVEIAINTPDIAIIQGPPGTGKTTVIKAICERYKEILGQDNKSAQILITSYQNEAVNNAIINPVQGEVPCFRKTSLRLSKESDGQYMMSVDQWIKENKLVLEKQFVSSNSVELLKEAKILKDAYFSYRNTGEKPRDAKKIIQKYLSFFDIEYPKEKVDNAMKMLSKIENENVEMDFEDPIVKILEAQRLNWSAFQDDGKENAKRLIFHLSQREELNMEPGVLSSLQAATIEHVSDVEFNSFINTIKDLKNNYGRTARLNVQECKKVVSETILHMHSCFINQYENEHSDLESKKSMILSDFMERLEMESETLVPKYSNTTAATCQVSLDKKNYHSQKYDLVIIDEAARANPLDLFIPMSMGKKVILVGDHKQLPHMLEPEVLKRYIASTGDNDISKLQISLFERLYESHKEGLRPKAIQLSTQYRMHPTICDMVSEMFYENTLKSFEGATALKTSSIEINKGKPITFVHIPIERGAESSGQSKYRESEIVEVCEDIKKILEVETKSTIGVITFYMEQSRRIKKKLEEKLDYEELSRVEVGTVDSFQGKEYDYVLLSCVRSNTIREDLRKSIGFLDAANRLCVAFSRAIRQLVIYGDAETLSQVYYFRKILELCKTKGVGLYRE